MTNARKTDANKPTSKFTKVSASIKLAGADVTSGMMNGRHYDRRQMTSIAEVPGHQYCLYLYISDPNIEFRIVFIRFTIAKAWDFEFYPDTFFYLF